MGDDVVAASAIFSAVMAEATEASAKLRAAFAGNDHVKAKAMGAATLFAVQASVLGGLAGLSARDIAEGLRKASDLIQAGIDAGVLGSKDDDAKEEANSKKELPNWEA